MSETRDRLLDAALEVFSEKGFEAATVREIADRAGVRDITVFRHFGTKENLLTEIHNRRSVAPMAADLLEQAGNRPVEEVLHELGRRFYTQLLSRQKMVRLLVIESGRNTARLSQVSEVPRAIHTNLTAYLAAKMKEGLIRQGDPAAFARAFMSLFFSLVVGRDFLPEDAGETPDDTARVFVDIFLRGVVASTDHGGK